MESRRIEQSTIKSMQYEFVAKAMYLVLEQGDESVKKDMINNILQCANMVINQD